MQNGDQSGEKRFLYFRGRPLIRMLNVNNFWTPLPCSPWVALFPHPEMRFLDLHYSLNVLRQRSANQQKLEFFKLKLYSKSN